MKSKKYSLIKMIVTIKKGLLAALNTLSSSAGDKRTESDNDSLKFTFNPCLQ